MVKRFGLGLSLWVLFLSHGFAQDAFTQGEEFFLQNRPREAISFLEVSLGEDPANVRAALYLGISYQQLDRLDDAIAMFLKILPRGGAETARIAFNLGNAYYSKGSVRSADQYYTQAIEADPAYASAYLNRANVLTHIGSLQDAVSDYERYLSLEPRSPKRPQIEDLLRHIKEEFAGKERRRIEAELAAQAEAERKQRLLDEISASLQTATEKTTGLSTGTEKVLEYDDQFEME
jgi:tetratricopeptide (TPR) repeat protein